MFDDVVQFIQNIYKTTGFIPLHEPRFMGNEKKYLNECIEEGVLLTDNYDDFDMSKLIVKTPIPHDEYYNAIRQVYKIAFHPRFLAKQLKFLASFNKKDWQFLFTYGIRAVRRVRQHVFNLTKHERSS